MEKIVRSRRPDCSAQVNRGLLVVLGLVVIIGGIFFVRRWFSKPVPALVVTEFVAPDGTTISDVPLEIMAMGERDKQGNIKFPDKLGLKPIVRQPKDTKGGGQ